jgi:AcrR family transcriptional regulator
MSSPPRRRYSSELRDSAAKATRERIQAAAKDLFAARGIEAVKLSEIAAAAGVSVSTVYASFGSREGILRALMEAALFGPHYRAALARLEGETDPVRLIELTPAVSRAIYEGEARELGLLREIAAYSPTLRAMEREFEAIRHDLQEGRVRALFEAGLAREGLSEAEARRLLWMYTSRDVHRMLVLEGGWSGDAYEGWLRRTLLETLVAPGARPA